MADPSGGAASAALPAVTVYTTPTCTYCHQAITWLEQRGVPFRQVDVAADRNALMKMAQLSGQTGTPVITVGPQVVVGFDRLQLARLLPELPLGQSPADTPVSVEEAAPRPQLGAAVATMTPALAAERGIPALPGVLVGAVTPGGAAERDGLRPGDLLVEANGWTLADRTQLERMVQKAQPGEELQLVVWRDGDRVRLKLVPLAAEPARA